MGDMDIPKQRFSTFKLFKSPAKPPQPPPKELAPVSTIHSNRSLLSLSPSSSHPYDTPNSSASMSSASLAPAPSPSPKPSRKGSMFFKFGRKNKTVPQTREQEDAPADEGISTPWNFEHTIHVNETLVGLPPSWSHRLTECGYSEEEIVALQEARRAAGSVSLYRLNTQSGSSTQLNSPYGYDRSASPISMSSRGTNPARPSSPAQSTWSYVTRPSPRTTSLPRNPSDVSRTTTTSPRPPLPTHNTMSSMSSTHSSYRQRQMSLDSRESNGGPPPPNEFGLMETPAHPQAPSLPPPIAPPSQTPSTRRFIIANPTPPIMSPPPAYETGSFQSINLPPEKSQRRQEEPIASSSSTPPPPPIEKSPDYEQVVAQEEAPKTHTRRRSKRFSVLPPRLSLSLGTVPLGTDTDDWSASLLSAAGGGGFGLIKEDDGDEDDDSKRDTIVASKFSVAGLLDTKVDSGSKSMPSTPYASAPTPPIVTRSNSESTAPSTPPPSSSPLKEQVTPKSRPVPSIVLPPLERPTSMWDDLADIVDKSRSSDDSLFNDVGYLSAAFEGSSSPILPPSPGAGDRNRDSTQSRFSTASTSTVTAHTIVKIPPTGLERGVRAMASVLSSPPMVVQQKPPEKEQEVKANKRQSISPGSRALPPPQRELPAVPPETTPTPPPKGTPVAKTTKTATPPPSKPTPPPQTTATPPPPKTATPPPKTTATPPPKPSTIKAQAEVPPEIPAWKLALAERTKNGTVSPPPKKRPAELLLPPPASSFGFSAIGANLASVAAKSPGHSRQSSSVQETRQTLMSRLESPQSSHFGSEESGTASSSSRQSQPTPTTDDDDEEGDSNLLAPIPQTPEVGTPILSYYTDEAPTYAPTKELDAVYKTGFVPSQRHSKLTSVSDTFGGDDSDEYEEEDEDEPQVVQIEPPPQLTVTSSFPSPPVSPSALPTPPTNGSSRSRSPTGRKSPMECQPWVWDLLAPIRSYIDDSVDCRDYYMDLQEMAEGESGSVFAAHVLDPTGVLTLPAPVRAREVMAYSASLPSSSDSLANLKPAATGAAQVAIKCVRLTMSGTPKLRDVQNELDILHDLWHENVLGIDALYVDLVDDALWIRMELMERSVADVLALVENGLMVQERMMARMTSDLVLALEFLESHEIAHRDVRSDNLLMNRQGFVKLADFSNAVRIGSHTKALTEPVGVVFWQSPEMRRGSYNASKVDIWSLGATLWEMAESQPPVNQDADKWPPLSQASLFSPSFHDFLKMCGRPEATRPTATSLVSHPFIQNACGRTVIVQLLSQCVTIESQLQEDA